MLEGNLMDALNTYGKRVKFLRENLGMLQKEFRDALERRGVPIAQGYASVIENTDQQPTGEIVSASADILHTSADFLLMRTDNPAPLGETDGAPFSRVMASKSGAMILLVGTGKTARVFPLADEMESLLVR